MTALVHARTDREGRLTAADPKLRALNAAAGGGDGAPIALPAIAAIVRLALRLGVLVSRSAIVADGDRDLDLWVRARPDEAGVSLTLGDWTPAEADAGRRDDLARAAAAWTWETDGTLRLVSVGLDGAPGVGRPLTELVRLVEEEETGALPLLDALARRRGFAGQRAVLRADGAALLLGGSAMVDDAGGFTGFRGTATPAPTPGGGSRRRDMTAIGPALRRPLDRILAGAEAMGTDRGPYGGYAADIAQAARHLIGLVDDLADIDALDRSDLALPVERVDLATLARRAAGLHALRGGERGVRVDPPGEAERLPALGEPRRVLQILVNLVGNAIGHSPDGGIVWVRASAEGGRASVIVADQGRGIAAEDQARIFEKFARIDPGAREGSGLGLYLSRRLARAMGGDVAVDSAPGQGARFVLTLPSC